MNIKCKYCDTCQDLMIDNEGQVVKLFTHLYKGVAEIDICSDCSKLGVNIPFEKIGFIQAYFKQQSGVKE